MKKTPSPTGHPNKRQRTHKAMRRRLFDETGGKCWFCARVLSGGWLVDHLTPVCKGGTNAHSNLVASCEPCNTDKGARTLEEFRARPRRVLPRPGLFYGEILSLEQSG